MAGEPERTRILIPTDFTPRSLQLVEYAILNYPNKKLDIFLVHGYRMSDSKWGAINFSPIREINKLSDEAFCKAKRDLCREHRQEIGSIKVLLFTGHNAEAFKNFMAPYGLHKAVVPSGRLPYGPDTKSFDTTPYIRKGCREVIEVAWENGLAKVAKPRFSFLGFFQ